MAKYFICGIICMMTMELMAQPVKESRQPQQKIDYLEKGRRQNRVAWSSLAGGFSLIFISSKISSTAVRNGSYYSNQFLPNTMFLAGAAGMIVSIPFFIGAAKNKGRGMLPGVKLEPLLDPGRNFLHQSFYPAFVLKVPL